MTGDGSEWQWQKTQLGRDSIDTIGVIARGFSDAGPHTRRCTSAGRADGRRNRARRPTHDRQAVAPRSRHRQRGRTASTPPLQRAFQHSFPARHVNRDSTRRPRNRGKPDATPASVTRTAAADPVTALDDHCVRPAVAIVRQHLTWRCRNSTRSIITGSIDSIRQPSLSAVRISAWLICRGPQPSGSWSLTSKRHGVCLGTAARTLRCWELTDRPQRAQRALGGISVLSPPRGACLRRMGMRIDPSRRCERPQTR